MAGAHRAESGPSARASISKASAECAVLRRAGETAVGQAGGERRGEGVSTGWSRSAKTHGGVSPAAHTTNTVQHISSQCCCLTHSHILCSLSVCLSLSVSLSLSLSLSEVAQPQNAHTPNPKYSSRSTYCQPLFFIIIIIMTTGRGGSTRTTCHSRFIHTYAQNSVNQPAKTGSGKSFGADPHLPVGSCHQLAPRHEQRGLSSH